MSHSSFSLQPGCSHDSTHSPRPNEQGLTLIELLLVTLLLSVLFTILYGTLNGLIRARNTVDRERLATLTAQSVYSRLTRELLNGASSPALRQADNPNGTSSGSSSPRANAQPRLSNSSVRGIRKRLGANDGHILRFISANTGQEVANGPTNFGPLEIEYRLEEQKNDDGTVATATDNNGRQQSLWQLVREESPAGSLPTNVLDPKTIIAPVASNVTEFRCRYLVNGRWQAEWPGSQTAARTPQAIEVTLKLRPPDSLEETFRSALPVLSQGTMAVSNAQQQGADASSSQSPAGTVN